MMLLHSSCCSRELGLEDVQRPIQNRILSSSSCKLQTLHASSNVRFVLRFNCLYNHHSSVRRQQYSFVSHPVLMESDQTQKNPYARKRNPATKVPLGFKLRCHSKAVILPRNSTFNGKKKKYGGGLPLILRSLESNDDIEKILDSHKGKLSPKEQTVILKEQGRWERIFRVFEWMKAQEDYMPNVIHYNVVLRALGRAQKWDELRLCWVDMAKYGVLPTNNTYGMLVDVYGKAGLVKEALLWIRHMKLRGFFPDEVTMNTVVKVLKDAKEFELADRFYKNWCVGKIELGDLDLSSIADSDLSSSSGPISLKGFLSTELFKTGGRSPRTNNGSPNEKDFSVRKPRLTATFNTLIDLYGKADRLKDAAEVFAEMLKSGVAVDTFTFNTMIFICGSHGHLSEAEALLRKMEEKGVSPDTKTYNIFLSLYAATGDIFRALQYYRKIREAGLFPDVVTHRAILKILCENNMVQEVESVLGEMEKLGLRIDDHSFPVLVKMYVNEGLLEQAKATLEKGLLDGGFSSKTCAAIIDAYAEKGLWAEAEDVFYGKRDLVARRKDVTEYNVMIKAYGKAKLFDKAYSFFKSMKRQGTWPDECTYNSLIQMLSGGDLVDQAREVLAEMQEMGYKPSCLTFSAIIASYARSSRLSVAFDILAEMERSGIKPNEVVYGSIIDGLAEAGRVDEASHYFRIMQEEGIPMNQVVLTSMIKVYAKIGSAEGAKSLYEKMKGLEGGPDIIAANSMLNLYADLGMVSEAILIFEDLRAKGWADAVTFATMMFLYKNMGMPDEAIDIADEMKLSGLLKDCVSFNKVMACYATNGKLVECGELLHKMLSHKLLPDGGTFKVLFTVLKKGGLPPEAVTQLDLCYREGKPFARQAILASVFSIVGMYDLAIKSCETIMKANAVLDSFALNVAIYTYGASGDVDKALNIFMKMQDEGLEPDLVTYIYLVVCYGKAGMLEGVKRIHSLLKYDEIEPNESLFQAVASAYMNANRRDLAELVSQEMRFALETEHNSASELEEDDDETSQSL